MISAVIMDLCHNAGFIFGASPISFRGWGVKSPADNHHFGTRLVISSYSSILLLPHAVEPFAVHDPLSRKRRGYDYGRDMTRLRWTDAERRQLRG